MNTGSINRILRTAPGPISVNSTISGLPMTEPYRPTPKGRESR